MLFILGIGDFTSDDYREGSYTPYVVKTNAKDLSEIVKVRDDIYRELGIDFNESEVLNINESSFIKLSKKIDINKLNWDCDYTEYEDNYSFALDNTYTFAYDDLYALALALYNSYGKKYGLTFADTDIPMLNAIM